MMWYVKMESLTSASILDETERIFPDSCKQPFIP
jgi:hypothetical protein